MIFILNLFNLFNVILATYHFESGNYYLVAFFLFLIYLNCRNIEKLKENENENESKGE